MAFSLVWNKAIPGKFKIGNLTFHGAYRFYEAPDFKEYKGYLWIDNADEEKSEEKCGIFGRDYFEDDKFRIASVKSHMNLTIGDSLIIGLVAPLVKKDSRKTDPLTLNPKSISKLEFKITGPLLRV